MTNSANEHVLGLNTADDTLIREFSYNALLTLSKKSTYDCIYGTLKNANLKEAQETETLSK